MPANPDLDAERARREAQDQADWLQSVENMHVLLDHLERCADLASEFGHGDVRSAVAAQASSIKSILGNHLVAQARQERDAARRVQPTT
jgi:hypothetical protein